LSRRCCSRRSKTVRPSASRASQRTSARSSPSGRGAHGRLVRRAAVCGRLHALPGARPRPAHGEPQPRSHPGRPHGR
jgi:hypothetical protein